MDTKQRLHDNFLKGIGRNLLAYQMIERNLKVILPFLEKKYNPERFKLATLGNLITQFINCAKIEILLEIKEDTEDDDFIKEEVHRSFVDDLRELVKDRNELIHNFSGLSQLLNSEMDYEYHIDELDSKYKKILSFLHDLSNHFVWIVAGIYKTFPNNQEIHQKYMNLKQNLPVSTVFIDFDNPFETTWYKTKIIRYLLIAEKQLKNQDGMTSLSHAGKFIKQLEPNVIPQKYGVKNLTGILIASKLFDIYTYSTNKQKFYKSKYSCIAWNLEEELEKEIISIN